MPNANALVKGNEVRIGGARVGVVKSVKPVQIGNGRVAAELDLSLDKNAEPIPVNSTMIIRPKSPLGLKYLQIVPGDSTQGLRGRRNDPALRRPARTGRHRPVLRHVRRKDPQGDPAQPGRLRQRPRRPRPAAQRRLRRPAQAGRKRPAGAARPGRPEHRLRRLLAKRWRTSRRRSPRSPSSRRACSSPSTAPSPPSPASPAPSSRKRSSKGPATLDAVTADLPALRPFLHDSGRFFAALKPGRQRPRRNLADDRRRPARRHPRAQPLAGALRAADRRPPKRCSPSRRRPASSTASTC